MGQMYNIHYYPSPSRDAGFMVYLFSDWKRAVSLSGITQETINDFILHSGLIQLILHFPHVGKDWPWYKGNKLAKPIESFSAEEKLLVITKDLDITWGEWGPERISVPGNGWCGIYLDHSKVKDDSAALVPHNVGSLEQFSLLMYIFLEFADKLQSTLEGS